MASASAQPKPGIEPFHFFVSPPQSTSSTTTNRALFPGTPSTTTTLAPPATFAPAPMTATPSSSSSYVHVDKRASRANTAQVTVLSRSAPSTPEPRKPTGANHTPAHGHAHAHVHGHGHTHAGKNAGLVPFEFGGEPVIGFHPPQPQQPPHTPGRLSLYDMPMTDYRHAPHYSTSDLSSQRVSPPTRVSPPRQQASSPSSQRFADKGRPPGHALPNPIA